MNLSHDAQGFLLGRSIAQQSNGSATALAVLKSVRRDVFLIRRLMESQMGRAGSLRGAAHAQAGRVQPSGQVPAVAWGGRRLESTLVARALSRALPADSGQGAVAIPRPRDARGRYVRMQAGAPTLSAESPQTKEAGQTSATESMPAAMGPVGLSRRRASPRQEGQHGGVGEDRGRDARGRFVGASEPAQDQADSDPMGKVSDALQDIGAAMAEANNIDPALTAIQELGQVVSPVGRGIVALHNRATERKREKWYARLLKAIIAGKGKTGDGGGGAEGDVRRGSFFGTMLGELAGRLIEGLGASAGGVLGALKTVFARVFMPVAAVWGSWEIGKWIGGKTYEWLDKSGIAAKVFDAFDAVSAWVKGRLEEAKPIVQAVAKKVDASRSDVSDRVSRNVSTGVMNNWGRAKKNLVDASERAGVDPGIVAKIARFESGFSESARPRRKDGTLMSSAHGYGQLLDSTWHDMINKYGAKYGVDGAGSLTRAQAMALRKDPKLQASMLAELTRENVERGRKLGGSNDDANVYALHNLGAGDGAKFLKALKADPQAPVSSVLSPKVIANNPSLYKGGSATLAESYRLMGEHMAVGNVFAAEVSTVKTPALAKPSMPASVSVSMPAIKPPAVPMPVPERSEVVPVAPVPERLGGSERSKPVLIIKDEANQDVRDRRLAHIVTGGIGG